MGTIPLGEDILLARHGANIVKFRQDRKKRSTIAYLSNGTTDTASNEMRAQVQRTPAMALNETATKYMNNQAGISREEVRSLTKISLGFSAAMGAIFGGLLLALYHVGGTEALQSLASTGMLP